jgi:hypothetical protein
MSLHLICFHAALCKHNAVCRKVSVLFYQLLNYIFQQVDLPPHFWVSQIEIGLNPGQKEFCGSYPSLCQIVLTGQNYRVAAVF